MTALTMMIEDPAADTLVVEHDVYRQLLPLTGARIIELGCGSARHTRQIAETCAPESILACEVDQQQLQKNLAITDLPNVQFTSGVAEDIPAEDTSADIVMMFKSLHHVPVEAMSAAMQEIARVLRPGGLAYISEPVYAGAFNEVLKLFHDEGEVRRAAFDAVRAAVANQTLELVEQRFFNTPNYFTEDGAHFVMPIRVDLLRRAA